MTDAGNKPIVYICFVIIAASLLTGCRSYTTPGGAADLSLFARKELVTIPPGTSTTTPQDYPRYSTGGNQGSTIEISQRRPTASFPVDMVAVRVQESGYTSCTNTAYGRGNYSVVTVRDIEKDEDFDRIGKLPGIAQISPLSRLLLPDYLHSDKELRQAAGRLRADMILIYTLETDFYDRDSSTPLSIISLGLAPTIKVRVTTTISAMVMDTRTGYIYGILEETSRKEQVAAVLTTQNAFDELRQKTERQAFELFLDEFEVLFKNITNQYWK
jgi:hypothetical protein